MTGKYQIYIRLPDLSRGKKGPVDPYVVGFSFANLGAIEVVNFIDYFMQAYPSTKLADLPAFESISHKERMEIFRGIFVAGMGRDAAGLYIEILQPLMPLSYENGSGITFIDIKGPVPAYCNFMPKLVKDALKQSDISADRVMVPLSAGDYLGVFFPAVLDGMLWDASLKSFRYVLIGDAATHISDALDIDTLDVALSEQVKKVIRSVGNLNRVQVMTFGGIREMFKSFPTNNKGVM